MATSDVSPKETPRWGWIVALVLLGVVLLGLGWCWAEETHPWRYLSGVAVNVGTALLLASFLVWFERNFMKKVEARRDVAVEQASDRAAEKVSLQTIEQLEPKFQALNAQVAALAAEHADRVEKTIDTMVEALTREAVCEALAEAAAAGAIRADPAGTDGSIIVAAGATVQAPRIRVAWEKGPAVEPATRSQDVITLSYAPDESASTVESGPWSEGEELAEAIDSLKRRMIKSSRGAEARSIDAQAFITNLQTAIREALLSRSADPSSSFGANAFYEFLWNGWAVTELGLEIPGSKLLAAAGTSFPSTFRSTWEARTAPRKPEWIKADDESWITAWNITKSHFLWRADTKFAPRHS